MKVLIVGKGKTDLAKVVQTMTDLKISINAGENERLERLANLPEYIIGADSEVKISCETCNWLEPDDDGIGVDYCPHWLSCKDGSEYIRKGKK